MRKDTARNATPGEPPGDRSRLCGRIRAEAVVDDQRNDTAITRSRPTVEQDGQRQAVGTTGTGHGKLRRRFERTEQIGRPHVSTPVTNAHLLCRLLLEKKKKNTTN